MYIKKIIIGLDAVKITYTHSGTAGERETKFKAWEKPHPDFVNACIAVVPAVAPMLGASDYLDAQKNTRLHSVCVDTSGIGDHESLRRASVTLARHFDKVEKPLIVKSMDMIADIIDGHMTMSEDAATAILKLVKESRAYMNGKTAQEDLFKKDENGDQDAFKAIGKDDPLLSDAIEFMKATGRASTPSIQKQFDIAYSRAYALLQAAHEMNILGARQKDGSYLLQTIKDKDGRDVKVTISAEKKS